MLTLATFAHAGAAHSATHCSVFAQLIVKGHVYGTKTFIVPLRDPKTYQLLPGIAIGDIGKKMGRDGIDNGWMCVRVPCSAVRAVLWTSRSWANWARPQRPGGPSR